MAGAGGPNFGKGILYVVTYSIYFFITSSFLFWLTILPSFAWLLLLEPSLLNVLPVIFMGPALSAITRFMIRYIETDYGVEDYPTGKDYFRFYKENFKEAIKIWTPYVLVMTVLGTNVQHYNWGGGAIAAVADFLYIFLMAAATLLVGYMLLISAKYRFKLKDLIRLSAYYAFTWIKTTLAVVAVLFLVLAAVFFLSEYLVLLFAAPLAYILVRYAYPVLANVGEYFVAGKEEQAE